MPTSPKQTLSAIINSAHIPAISYSCVEQDAKKSHEHNIMCASVGKKDAQSLSNEAVDGKTIFPASSLSKIVFTYLVLKLVESNYLSLDEPLHDILRYKRFQIAGKYPKKSALLTARHVLSHTTGLPNLGSNSTETLQFHPNCELGKTYSYSGEAFLYLQRVIESKMGKNLECLAQEYVFKPLGMTRTTFVPPSEQEDNIVKVHTEMEQSQPIFVGKPRVNAAGSLLTTAEDFSSFISAWLSLRDNQIFRQAFQPYAQDSQLTCGLGWHLYQSDKGLIAYQFGENPNTRAFMAVNLTKGKGAVYFTSSESGMSIADKIFNNPDLMAVGELSDIYHCLSYTQSSEPGWVEILSGKIAEERGDLDLAKQYFAKALELAPSDPKIQRRFEWFNQANGHLPVTFKTQGLASFKGIYTNKYNDKFQIAVKGNKLILNMLDREIELVRVSKTDFIPAKDQAFKLSIKNGQMTLHSIHGYEKSLSRKTSIEKQRQYKERLHKLRDGTPGYAQPTKSSQAKIREKVVSSAVTTPWRP